MTHKYQEDSPLGSYSENLYRTLRQRYGGCKFFQQQQKKDKKKRRKRKTYFPHYNHTLKILQWKATGENRSHP